MSQFSWADASRRLSGLPAGQGINIAYECVDRHAAQSPHRLACRFLRKQGGWKGASYADLSMDSNRFASVLSTLGVKKGESVFTLLGRCSELYSVVLGTLKNRSVICPLFSAFGPDPIRTRLDLGDARVLVTTESHYRKKVAPIRSQLHRLKWILLVRDSQKEPLPLLQGALDFDQEMLKASPAFEIGPTAAEDPAVIHFTSGTTGRPKAAIHVHQAILTHAETGRAVFDLRPGDIYWCTADPGWVTGISYGIFAPLVNGVTLIVDEAEFEGDRWYRVLQEQKVTVWYTAPTAIRMLMKLGDELPKKFDLSRLRWVGSVGEPLNPEAVKWGAEVLGIPIHDNWWQTETGGIMIANLPGMPIRPGSMGRPIPGIEAAIVRRVSENQIEVITEPGVKGELALKRGWPSMFRGYLHEEERYKKCFVGDYYLTGDLAKVDSDGYFWFVGRADDVIKTSGHLIGPFEVESVLMEHPAVSEVAVIGKPDALAMEIVKAFVSLKKGFVPSEKLKLELIALGRMRLGAAIAPKEIEFKEVLPHTRSGKIMRRLLKCQESGLPLGDTSMLEGAA